MSAGTRTVDAPGPAGDAGLAAPGRCADLFVAFTRLALQGFGGVLPVAQRDLVERLRWLTHPQFLELLSLAQVLPGPNVVNLALMIGQRHFGWRGALAALAGILAAPAVVVLSLAVLAAHWRNVPLVADALQGMAIVAAGLVASTALKAATALRRNVLGVKTALAFTAATFVAVGLLRWPLVWCLPVIGTAAWAAAHWRIAKATR